MASFTSIDNKNLALFILHQKKIFRRNQLLKSGANIGSHSIIRIWRCLDEYTYRDPVELDPRSQIIYEREENIKHEDWLADLQEVSDMAIVTEWYFDRSGCETISCNPYYPGKGVCKGFDQETVNEKEAPFAFTTGHNQRIDVCQPICYDEDQVKNTYVGMMSLYAAKNHMCYVTDPQLIAFYLDPHRRVSDEQESILEKSAFKIGLEYLGPTGVPAIVAKIGEEYCDQYGLDYVEEKNELDSYQNGNTVNGCCKIDKNEGAFTALSTWTGNTITRAYNFGRIAFRGMITDVNATKEKQFPPDKGPTTMKYLADEKQWRANVDDTKKQLPFPLKLIHLGLHNKSDGLMWTDEYSFIDDGRNDMYGGRLIEKPRSISRPPWSMIKICDLSLNIKSNIKRAKRELLVENKPASAQQTSTVFVKGNTNIASNKTDELERQLVIGLNRSIDEYKRTVSTLSGLRDSVAGSSFEIMIDQIIAGTTVEVMGDLFKQFGGNDGLKTTRVVKDAVKSLIRRFGSSVSTKSIGIAMTQTAIRTGIETRVVSSVASLLKLPFRALMRGSNILTLISLFGAAVDLFTAFVYNPYSKYERYMSDRLLRQMAQIELEITQRLIGCQRLLLEPYDWIVNTRYLDVMKDSMYDLLLGMMYTKARRINSEGSLIYWYDAGGIQNIEGETVFLNKNDGAKIESDSLDRVFNTFSDNDILEPVLRETYVIDQDKINKQGKYYNFTAIPLQISISWYVFLIFMLFTAISLTGLTKSITVRFMIPLTVFASLFTLNS